MAIGAILPYFRLVPPIIKKSGERKTRSYRWKIKQKNEKSHIAGINVVPVE